jgi:PTS system ascorbate-specific IIB component
MDRIRVLAICGFGVGTSMLLKTKLQSVFDELGVGADVSTSDISSAASTPCDVMFTSAELAESLSAKTTAYVAVINNFVSKPEITQKVKSYLEERKEG